MVEAGAVAQPMAPRSRLIHKRRSKDHSLVLACVTIMGVAGICTSMNVSPLLACMASGTAYVNASGNKHLFKQLNQFTPPLLVMFFVLSGMRLAIPSLAAAGLIGVIYFLIRIAGKYAGSSIGAAVIHASPEIRRYFGLALIPQAGVSIGLAVLGQRMLPTESGLMLSTIILSSGLLYEMVGPACSKAAIKLSGSIPAKGKATGKPAEKAAEKTGGGYREGSRGKQQGPGRRNGIGPGPACGCLGGMGILHHDSPHPYNKSTLRRCHLNIPEGAFIVS